MVILVTGHPDLPEIRRSEAARKIARVLAKPYDPRRLSSWVHSTVKLARMSRATAKLAQHTQAMRQQKA
jgi:response regulator RpfG family c-di-GMP phosphodiesterase